MKYNTHLRNFLTVWTTKTIHRVGEKTTVSSASGVHWREPDHTAKSSEATGPQGALPPGVSAKHWLRNLTCTWYLHRHTWFSPPAPGILFSQRLKAVPYGPSDGSQACLHPGPLSRPLQRQPELKPLNSPLSNEVSGNPRIPITSGMVTPSETATVAERPCRQPLASTETSMPSSKLLLGLQKLLSTSFDVIQLRFR